MYYIKSEPTENGNYGNPVSTGEILLPDRFLDGYLEAMGFVNISIENGVVTTMETNEEALEAYIASLPVEPDNPPEEEVTTDDILNALLGVTE